MARNYRGRFEGPQPKPKRRGNLMLTVYNKFWMALIGAVLMGLKSWTGVDFEVLGLTPEIILSGITAILVYFVPNIKT